MAYSSRVTSSTILMNKQSSSIKSSFVGVREGERINDCEMSSTSDDVFDGLRFSWVVSRIIQSVGSVLSSSSSMSQFLILSSYNFESNKMIASFDPKYVIWSYKVIAIVSFEIAIRHRINITIRNKKYLCRSVKQNTSSEVFLKI